MVDHRARAADPQATVGRWDRWGALLLMAGFAAGAGIGLGLPALVAYQLRADPVEVPTEWRTESGQAPAANGGGRRP